MTDSIQEISDRYADDIAETCRLLDSWTIDPVPLPVHSKRGFMTLPIEIRDAIYSYAMEDEPRKLHIGGNPNILAFNLRPGALPPICLVSKSIWMEACLTYLRQTRIENSAPWSFAFRSWLLQFPHKDGFRAIRTLVIRRCKWKGDWLYNEDMSLLLDYTGLRTLSIDIQAYTVSQKARIPGNPWQCYRVSSREQLWEKLDFGGLFQLPRLRHLKVLCEGACRNCRGRGDPCPETEELFGVYIDVLREGFSQEGAEMLVDEVVSGEGDATYLISLRR
jgi:hypothetical protein